MKNLLAMGIKVEGNRLFILDQRQLPAKEIWELITHPQQMISAIQNLSVRGAPLIGVAAALSLATFCEAEAPLNEFIFFADALRTSRPTAVNLMSAIDRLLVASKKNFPHEVIATAENLFEEDVKLCEQLAEMGNQFIAPGDRVLTHCNTGGLATVGNGTALGVIRKAHADGKKIHVFVAETRPLYQGARLTTWELEKLKIPFTLFADSMAASLMREKKINKIFVGADRIAANGDAANKIGTYSLAILAKFHKIPFYVVAPRTTVAAQTPTGADIPIEFRNETEILGERKFISGTAYNPAFDVTPRELITELIVV